MQVRVVSIQELERWDAKHLNSSLFGRPAKDLKPFAAVARRRIEPGAGVPLGSIHFDGTITVRNAKSLKGTTYIAHASDFVYSKIDLRNGAVGVVNPEIAPLAFTSEYPIYELTGIEPEYARLLCRTSVFRAQVQALVVGHSGRKRVDPRLLEGLLVPVPSLDEQRAVIQLSEASARAAEELQRRAESCIPAAAEQIVAELGLVAGSAKAFTAPFAVRSALLERWSVSAAIESITRKAEQLTSRYPIETLGSPGLATVTYGVQKSPANRPGQHARPYLRVANVQNAHLDLREIKFIDVPDEQLERLRLRPKDLLICEGNSAELVGRPAMWHGEIDDCVHQNHVLRARTDPSRLLPEYVLAYMQTAPARAHFRKRAKRTTNLATINSKDVKDLPIPLPPMPVQKGIAAILERAQADRLDALKAAQEESQREVQAVEASIVYGRLPEPRTTEPKRGGC